MAEELAPRAAADRPLVLSVLTVSITTMFFCLAGHARGDFDLRPSLEWLRPYDCQFRLLLLAPLWGGWAMIIAPKFCRPIDAAADPAAAAFAAGCGPLSAVLLMLVPLGGDAFYLQYLYGWWWMAISAVTIVAAPAAARLLSRRRGCTRSTLLAANLLTQIVFLLAYLVGLKWGTDQYHYY